MVDARGGAKGGCRHSGVRVIIPTRTPECLQPLIAPPLASTIKLTKNLILMKKEI